VQVAKRVDRKIDGGLCIVLIGDIGEGEARDCAQVGRQGFAGCAIGVGDDDGSAFSGEHSRRGCTEPRCAAGYKEDVIRDLHGNERDGTRPERSISFKGASVVIVRMFGGGQR